MQKGSSKQLIVGIVAGEVSGDILGAGLMSMLKRSYSNIRFVGVAGPLMQQEGCEVWFEMDELAVMGISEVLARLPRILTIRRQLKKRFTELVPDIFIGIDAPDFNLSLEYFLKQQGIKVVHYVSPSVWAWRQKRVFKIKSSVDKLLAFLPFEKDFYDKHGVPCQFVGHTMADKISLSPDKLRQRLQLGLDPKGMYLALLPGSRTSELTMLTEVFLRTAQQLQLQYPQLKILVPLVDDKRRRYFEEIYQKTTPNLVLNIFVGQAREIMLASDFTLLASGTAALECMLVKCPMVVAYKVKPLTYWLAKKLVKTPFYSLPNLLAGELLVDELLQDGCTVQELTIAIQKLIESPDSNYALKQRFTELHQQIRCHADEQAAKAVLELIE